MSIRNLALVAVVVSAFAPPLAAAPITTMDGFIGGYSLSAIGGSGTVTLTINNTITAVSQLNGTPVPGGFGGFIPTNFTPAAINIGGGGEPMIDFDVTKTVGPGGLDLDSNPVTGSAVFDANLNIVVVTPVAMIIQGNETLMSDTSSLDLSLFQTGSLVMTFNAPNPGGIVAIFQHAATGSGTLSLTGSGSFSQSNVPFGVVPEPGSLLVWAVLGAVCLAVLGMRRRHAAAAA